MSLRSLCRIAVPATMALLAIQFEAIDLFPLCVFAFMLLFMCRVFASDIGLYSLIAVVTTLVLSFFCLRTSMCPSEVTMPDSNEKKQQRKQQKKDLLTPETKKKAARKDKRKKKGKTMEDDNENLQRSGITKVYQTLKQFKDLHMPTKDLYSEFLLYVLTKKQLEQNRFPDSAIQRLDTKKSDLKEGPVSRNCDRCGDRFNVSVKEGYTSVTPCTYHPERFACISPSTMRYMCCNGDYRSSGCKTHFCHVSMEPILDNKSFRIVRDKRHVRAECDSAVYALDCEMCITTVGLQLTKIGIVNMEGLTIYETFVKPENPIVDYVTQYSGITANDLKGVTTTITDVQEFLLRLLNKDTILVGHGLENDLRMLKLVHENVVDTSVLFPRADGRKRKLKDLASEYLNESIQGGEQGHDCIEDARACMALVLWKIYTDLQSRPPVAQDENRNAYLQNQKFQSIHHHRQQVLPFNNIFRDFSRQNGQMPVFNSYNSAIEFHDTHYITRGEHYYAFPSTGMYWTSEQYC